MLQVAALIGRGVASDGRPTGAEVGSARGEPAAEEAVAARPGVKVVRSPRGVALPVLGEREGAWVVSTPCEREAVLERATPVMSAAVVIDAGHGGYDPGAVGPNGLTEAALNLSVARFAAEALERKGYTVVLTRASDHGMTLANRARLAVDLNAQVSVSVHHNAGAVTTNSEPGTEAYYQVGSEASMRLGGLIYEETVEALSRYPLTWVDIPGTAVTWRTRSNGDDYFAMVRLPKPVPTVLAELAYISSDAEAALLADPDVQRAEGEAVARAVDRFLGTDDPGTGYSPGRPMPPRPSSPAEPDQCDDPDL